jgi:hypothetical protein
MNVNLLFVAPLVIRVALSASVPRLPVQRVVFVDLSESPGPDDAVRWREAANVKVFERTNFGDSVIVYAVHDHTAESAPLFEVSVPMLGPDASMDETLRARKLLRHARVDGPVKLDEALRAPVRSRSTRLIESLRRIPKDPGRATEVLYLSDMLESTSELDLERTRISNANIVHLAQAAIERYRLTPGALDGVTFYCVLDSPRVGTASRKANDHQSLERFWRLVVTSLGGNLASFDSRIQ